MDMKVNFKNEQTNQFKQTKLGFSWTMLFFGVFVPLFRGDWKWFLVSLVIEIFTAGLAWFVFPFFYNKIYINELLEKGFVPADEVTESALRDKGILTY